MSKTLPLTLTSCRVFEYWLQLHVVSVPTVFDPTGPSNGLVKRRLIARQSGDVSEQERAEPSRAEPSTVSPAASRSIAPIFPKALY